MKQMILALSLAGVHFCALAQAPVCDVHVVWPSAPYLEVRKISELTGSNLIAAKERLGTSSFALATDIHLDIAPPSANEVVYVVRAGKFAGASNSYIAFIKDGHMLFESGILGNVGVPTTAYFVVYSPQKIDSMTCKLSAAL